MSTEWDGYQVEGERYRHDDPKRPGWTTNIKTVNDLTIEEAKDELVEAMKLIEKLTGHAENLLDEVRKAGYSA